MARVGSIRKHSTEHVIKMSCHMSFTFLKDFLKGNVFQKIAYTLEFFPFDFLTLKVTHYIIAMSRVVT